MGRKPGRTPRERRQLDALPADIQRRLFRAALRGVADVPRRQQFRDAARDGVDLVCAPGVRPSTQSQRPVDAWRDEAIRAIDALMSEYGRTRRAAALTVARQLVKLWRGFKVRDQAAVRAQAKRSDWSSEKLNHAIVKIDILYSTLLTDAPALAERLRIRSLQRR